MKHRIFSLALAGALLLSCAACSGGSDTQEESPSPTPEVSADEVLISLSDSGVTVSDENAGVTLDGEIIYYRDGTDESYGKGSESEKHSAEEAAAHTVVTITQPGTYRVTGTLSQGQIFVDLGEDARRDPEAVVTLILDNADITCTVAPAVFFYRVYECDTQWVAYDEEETGDYTPSPDVDTTAAGANVILAANSVNHVTGSHVARIYKEGTTKKLHKYDGAFYSRMSMNINGDNGDDSGVLSIVADNEGLDSELHLTLNGGTVSIESQDDGINTNEDGISVTTVNGGYLTVNAGLGSEGDGIDSNGYLTINGGIVWTMSNERTPDGGIDADCAITINGGSLSAFGTRNDAADSASAQPYMELSFASTLPAGTSILVTDEDGLSVWGATTQKACQSVTLSVAELAPDTVYHVYVNDVLQCYTGNSFGMMGGGQRPDGMADMTPPDGFDGEIPDGMELPDGFDPSQMGDFDPSQMGEPPEGFDPSQMGDMTPPEGMEQPGGMEGMTPPDGFGGSRGEGGRNDGMGGQQTSGEGETDFILTDTVKSFSGICDSAQSGKTQVTFRIEGSAADGVIDAITCSDEALPADQIQITVTDDPSEDYAESCLLSDGMDAVNDLLPGDEGSYILTVAVVNGNADYTGAAQVRFRIAGAEQD